MPQGIVRPETHRFTIGRQQDVVGSLFYLPLQDGDTYSDVARHYGLGYQEIAGANPGADPWVPKEGSTVWVPAQFVLPRAPRTGIVINLAAMRLFHFPAAAGGSEVVTYPVGIGREDRSTPTGPLSVVRKKERPIWYPTESIRNDHLRKGDPLPVAVRPGPDNPLGDFALYLSKPSYLIHGTNKPYSIGWRASNGCIRLYPENIEQLFPAVSVREPVLVVNQPYLVGWRDGLVYLQAHRPQEELNTAQLQKRVRSELKSLEAGHAHSLDWARIERVLAEARGIAVPISAKAPAIDAFLAQARLLRRPQRFFGAPVPPVADPGRWSVLVDETVTASVAARLVAFLNHQGPPIPARVEENGDRYRVIAGPYDTAKAAGAAVRRLQIELNLDGKLIEPAADVAASGTRTGRIGGNRDGRTMKDPRRSDRMQQPTPRAFGSSGRPA